MSPVALTGSGAFFVLARERLGDMVRDYSGD